MNKIYACIDLKSFYASVECVERGLNPLTTNLVVADSTRTEKTICLAVTPSLKQYGLSGRSRLYDVVAKVKEINKDRKSKLLGTFQGKSVDDNELKKNHTLELDYIIAPPRMKYYMKYSNNIYNIYLKYIAKEDIVVYSIDEVFLDITNYLKYYNLTPRELVTKMIQDVYETTGITATGGIGTNLYLAKIAMDIVAKHVQANAQGVRIAGLDEITYRKKLWSHRPLTDFWRIGKGLAKKLEENGMNTMGDIAEYSLENENKLFQLFGVNAELIIDHAWGWEPCTIEEIKKYRPQATSLSSGQVLHTPYDAEKAKLIVKEMTELLTLDMFSKGYVTDIIVLDIGYDISNLNPNNTYQKEIKTDYYGRKVPKPAHGTTRLSHKTSSTKLIMDAVTKLYDKIVDPSLLIRRINISVGALEEETKEKESFIEQFSLFTNIEEENKKIEKELALEKEEKKVQKAILDIKNKYGKNAILKGMNLEEGATTISRNKQVGGHKG